VSGGQTVRASAALTVPAFGRTAPVGQIAPAPAGLIVPELDGRSDPTLDGQNVPAPGGPKGLVGARIQRGPCIPRRDRAQPNVRVRSVRRRPGRDLKSGPVLRKAHVRNIELALRKARDRNNDPIRRKARGRNNELVLSKGAQGRSSGGLVPSRVHVRNAHGLNQALESFEIN
jgi:hypothetical protein